MIKEVRVHIKQHFAGGYRLEYDGKYITLLGKDNRDLVNAYADSTPAEYEERVLTPLSSRYVTQIQLLKKSLLLRSLLICIPAKVFIHLKQLPHKVKR